MDRWHLTVLKDDVSGDVDPVANVGQYNLRRVEIRWNADQTAFCPVALRWWDDASYIAYQCDCGDDEGRDA